MAARLIPLFPLHVVVFPRTPLPLHIFEERYKEMVGNALRDHTEFGVVLARDEGIVNAGCTVTVEKLIHLYPDGRMDILARGLRRFEVIALNQEKDYLQAEVSFFDDEETAGATPEELRAEAVLHYRDLQQLPASEERALPDLADPQLSFQLAQSLSDLDFLSVLLRHRSEVERLRQLNQYLSDYIPRQRAVERMKALAPTNGFGRKPSGL
jgi:Lon protease-like protein